MRPLPAQVDLPALERRVLQRWTDGKVFERSLEQTAAGEPWVFYEGPPTANGKPGTHHVEARVFKDLFPRFKTMQGRSVPRRAGWDCHGLPVELAVEKELGFSGKGDIEQYGVAEFNARCRESVGAARRRVRAAHRADGLLGRHVVGLLDDEPVVRPERLVEPEADRRQGAARRGPPRRAVLPPLRHRAVRPRGRAGLPGRRRPERLRALPGHRGPVVGARCFPARVDDDAVDAGLQHRGRGAPDGHLRRGPPRRGGARRRRAPARACWARTSRSWTASRARRSSTRRTPARSTSSTSPARTTSATADYVTIESGTGLVHQSPAFGAEDLAVARRYGLPVVNPVRPDGTFEEHLPLVGGQFFKTADRALVDRPARRAGCCSASSRTSTATRTAGAATPRCSTTRCRAGTSARPRSRTGCVEENERTDWHPATIKHGRYGDWLDNNIDWALSRNRYWGTPLPIWRCTADAGALAGVRLAGRARRGGRPGPVRARPAPARTSTTSSCPASAAARRPAGCRRSSTAGTTPARCRSRRSATRTPASSRPTRRSSSARRSTRRAAGSTR